MLRINLLPSYVTQRRLTKKLVPVFIGLFLLSIALPLVAYTVLHAKLVNLTQQANAAVSGKAITDGLKAQAVTTLAQVAPIKAKLQFVTDVDAYTRTWVALYNTLADTTPKSSFIYTGAQVTGPTMAIKAYSPSVEEVGRYLQVMYHEPDFSTVAVDRIPAYPDNIRHLYYLNNVLVFADGATGGGASGGGGSSSGFPGSSSGGFGGRGGPGGFPGGGGGFPGSGGFSGAGGGGQVASGAPADWTPDAIGPNGPTNIPPGVGPPPAEIAVGGTGAGTSAGTPAGSFGTPGGFGGAQQGGTSGYSLNFLRIAGRNISPFASPAIREQILHNALHRVVVRTVPKGFDINVTATLKQPLTPPVLPGTAPASGGSPGGFPGGFPGGPGGFRGGPGGFPGGPPPGPPGASGRPA